MLHCRLCGLIAGGPGLRVPSSYSDDGMKKRVAQFPRSCGGAQDQAEWAAEYSCAGFVQDGT